ncbi:MAG: flagellar basal body L-ring protein [Desulfovibrionaceae bacterium CG1_02_65_16]|nr:MAG: flagellar basal body L-ring protein [Desulfovibrionaceae bacterium CG1_02_65_16]
MNKRVTAFLLLAVLGGCAAEQKPMPEPVLTQLNNIEPEPVNNPASLFEAGQSDFLFDDNRANKVGDIVMVSVTETTTGKHKANTTATKTNANTYTLTAKPGGIYKTASGVVPGALGLGAGVNTTSDSSLTATGETKAESNLTAIVATRVIRMLPGKVMQVEGARQIRINDETQILVVRGLVRQRDIDSKNSVPSSALADARIEVYGQGALSDKQRSGWLTRLIDNVWPF